MAISKITKDSLCSIKREVKHVLISNEIVYLLITKEILREGEVIHPKFDKILKEFLDVFPKELLNELPPIHGIEHQIDHIPSLTLPNRTTYRCNPKEAKELQRQVMELMEKGFVKESMSPCTVPQCN